MTRVSRLEQLRAVLIPLMRGGFWNAVSAVFGQGSIFLTGILLAKMLGAESFGAYALLVSTLNTLANLAQLGSSFAAVKFIAEFRGSSPARVYQTVKECVRFVMIGTVPTSIVFVALSKPLSSGWLATPSLALPLAISAIAAALLARATVMQGVLSGLQKFREQAVLAAAHGIVYLAFCTIGAYLAGLTGVAVGLVLAAAGRLVLFEFSGRYQLVHTLGPPPQARASPEVRQRIVRFMIPAALAGMTTMPSLWFCSTVLAKLDQGLTHVAWLNVAMSLKNLVVLVPSLSTSVAAIRINDAFGRGDPAAVKSIVLTNTGLAAAIGVVLALTVFLGSDQLLALYGPEFAGAKSVLVAALAVAILEIVTQSLFSVIVARAQMWRSFLLIGLPRDLAIAGLAWWFAARGALGVMLAFAAIWALIAAVTGVWVGLLLKKRNGPPAGGAK